MQLVELIEGQGMHHAFWKASGAIALEAALAPVIDQRFGEDAPRRIAGTVKEYVVGPFIHDRFCPLWACALPRSRKPQNSRCRGRVPRLLPARGFPAVPSPAHR